MSVEQQIDKLLSRMTLQEKIGQMIQTGTFEEADKEKIRMGRIGSVLGVTGADLVNELQRIAVEESRLGIPLLIAGDVIHGYRTTFPIPLAEACSSNMALIEETAAVAAREASAAGIHWILAPMVDIARDPRWGRVAEGAGEDVWLAAAIARARVAGIQRNDWEDRPHMVACPKHFAGYGLAEAGRDYNTVDVSERRLRETYFPPFQAALEAGAGTMMCAFNELNGVPCTGNRWLLTDVLQQEWGFQGFVVSDWESIDELVQHGFAESREEAARIAIEAGVHMDMQARVYNEYLEQLVNRGIVPESVIDEAVRRILRIKFRAGLFDQPYTPPEHAASLLLHPDHVRTARAMARESIVLLKNEHNVLPLTSRVRKLAVVGPLADDRAAVLGCWAGQGRSEDAVSILQGIVATAEPDVEIMFCRGWREETAEPDIAQAVDIVRQCETAVVVLGETADMSGENNSRTSIELPSGQLELLKAIHATGVPVVLVLVNGRPLALEWADRHIPAIVEAWHLGTQAGMAVADILFGKHNPSGKLPITFPRSTGQIPIYYSAKKTGRPGLKRYADSEVEPLYPFGYGLSYTRFEYDRFGISSTEIKAGDTITVSARITNAGTMEGAETVQLYICDEAASITRPVKELKGFAKISLKPGESHLVEFRLSAEQLGFFNADGRYVVEPGRFTVWIGPDSRGGLCGTFSVIP